MVSSFSVAYVGFSVNNNVALLPYLYLRVSQQALYSRRENEDGSLDNKRREIRSPYTLNKPGGFAFLI